MPPSGTTTSVASMQQLQGTRRSLFSWLCSCNGDSRGHAVRDSGERAPAPPPPPRFPRADEDSWMGLAARVPCGVPRHGRRSDPRGFPDPAVPQTDVAGRRAVDRAVSPPEVPAAPDGSAVLPDDRMADRVGGLGCAISSFSPEPGIGLPFLARLRAHDAHVL